jgi:hypothetical protein
VCVWGGSAADPVILIAHCTGWRKRESEGGGRLGRLAHHARVAAGVLLVCMEGEGGVTCLCGLQQGPFWSAFAKGSHSPKSGAPGAGNFGPHRPSVLNLACPAPPAAGLPTAEGFGTNSTGGCCLAAATAAAATGGGGGGGSGCACCFSAAFSVV